MVAGVCCVLLLLYTVYHHYSHSVGEAHLSIWQWCVKTAGRYRQPPWHSVHSLVSLNIPAEFEWGYANWLLLFKFAQTYSETVDNVKKKKQGKNSSTRVLKPVSIHLIPIINGCFKKEAFAGSKFMYCNLTLNANVMADEFWDWQVLLPHCLSCCMRLNHRAVRAVTSLAVSHCLKRLKRSGQADGCHC